MSMSPIVSDIRRRLPQNRASVVSGSSRRSATSRSASGSASAIGVRLSLPLNPRRSIALADLRFARRAEPRERPEFLVRDRFLELVDILDSQLRTDEQQGLRAEAGNPAELDELWRVLRSKGLELLDLAGLDELE